MNWFIDSEYMCKRIQRLCAVYQNHNHIFFVHGISPDFSMGDAKCHQWSRNCFPIWSTRVHTVFIVGWGCLFQFFKDHNVCIFIAYSWSLDCPVRLQFPVSDYPLIFSDFYVPSLLASQLKIKCNTDTNRCASYCI